MLLHVGVYFLELDGFKLCTRAVRKHLVQSCIYMYKALYSILVLSYFAGDGF